MVDNQFELAKEWEKRPSVYYKKTHKVFRKKVSAFVKEHILPFVSKWDEAGTYPASLRQKAYDAGVFAALWPRELGGTPPEHFDAFHSLIWHEELARCGSGGLMASCFLPPGWALLPVIKHQLQESARQFQQRVCRQVISGRKTIALAVTEPNAGSDVANIKCTAVTDASDERFYLLTGQKYFVSNGLNADYMTVAVRLEEDCCSKKKSADSSRLAFLLVDCGNSEGVFRSRVPTTGWWLGATSFVTFKNVRVPKSQTVGKRNGGLVPILENFNHGRFAMFATANMYARVCLEDAVNYAKRRKTFGKFLIEHQIIRHKIAEMMRRVEAAHALIESVTYCIGRVASERKLAGAIAMCKIENAKVMEFCARESSQIFGGRSYIRGGVAKRVERIYREVCVMAIAEGATEVLNDFIVKLANL